MMEGGKGLDRRGGVLFGEEEICEMRRTSA